MQVAALQILGELACSMYLRPGRGVGLLRPRAQASGVVRAEAAGPERVIELGLEPLISTPS